MTRKSVLMLLCGALLLALFAGPVSAEADEVPIAVSPNVLNLGSEGTWVTVHAEISYSSVVSLGVYLNDLPVVYTKSDARGELVAKFNLDDVKEILEPGPNELTLTGLTESGDSFSGTDSILVIDKRGKR